MISSSPLLVNNDDDMFIRALLIDNVKKIRVQKSTHLVHDDAKAEHIHFFVVLVAPY